MSIFSERILALRDERKLSQAALAKEVGITSRTYQRYEAGERGPLMSTLVRMADFYGVSMDYLAGRTDTK